MTSPTDKNGAGGPPKEETRASLEALLGRALNVDLTGSAGPGDRTVAEAEARARAAELARAGAEERARIAERAAAEAEERAKIAERARIQAEERIKTEEHARAEV